MIPAVAVIRRPHAVLKNNGKLLAILYQDIKTKKKMDKEELKRLVLDEEKKGFIVFRTIEGLHRQEIDEFVKQPIESQLYDINRDLATCLAFIDEPFGVNNFSSMVLLRYYYDKCKELEQKLERYGKEEKE